LVVNASVRSHRRAQIARARKNIGYRDPRAPRIRLHAASGAFVRRLIFGLAHAALLGGIAQEARRAVGSRDATDRGVLRALDLTVVEDTLEASELIRRARERGEQLRNDARVERINVGVRAFGVQELGHRDEAVGVGVGVREA